MATAYPTPDEVLDTGPQGCGELLMTLALLFRKIEPGQVVAVTSHDPGAVEDIPAWCRLRGHDLLAFEPLVQAARYYIRRGTKL